MLWVILHIATLPEQTIHDKHPTRPPLIHPQPLPIQPPPVKTSPQIHPYLNIAINLHIENKIIKR